jgi:hypothetical protein
MWVERTPEEAAGWQRTAQKEAHSHGLMIGILAWAFAALVLSAGWFVSLQTGVAAQRGFGGTFWTRLPIFALLGSPVIFIARRYESRKALRKAERLTICAQCDSAGEGNAGATCSCGGTFVPSRTLKWVED